MNLTPQAAVQEMASFAPAVEAEVEKHLAKYPAERILAGQGHVFFL